MKGARRNHAACWPKSYPGGRSAQSSVIMVATQAPRRAAGKKN